jgi:eukaryotic-like serine/threonine-protein kinase
MGEVYRARDTRLGREVALKVLHEDVAQDSDRIARFEREAQSLAALNHPHIGTLFDMDQDAGRHFLVNAFPVWSPDSQKLAFQSNREGEGSVW